MPIDLPLLLCGPMLRRVDDRHVSGWVALSEPRKRNAPNKRPHQLFMTGEQIYADFVGTALLTWPCRLATEVPKG